MKSVVHKVLSKTSSFFLLHYICAPILVQFLVQFSFYVLALVTSHPLMSDLNSKLKYIYTIYRHKSPVINPGSGCVCTASAAINHKGGVQSE